LPFSFIVVLLVVLWDSSYHAQESPSRFRASCSSIGLRRRHDAHEAPWAKRSACRKHPTHHGPEDHTDSEDGQQILALARGDTNLLSGQAAWQDDHREDQSERAVLIACSICTLPGNLVLGPVWW
jgi:hypothetical protein